MVKFDRGITTGNILLLNCFLMITVVSLFIENVFIQKIENNNEKYLSFLGQLMGNILEHYIF